MSNKGLVWLNNELVPWENATVPLLSHGFSRGSAIFEVFGVHEGPNGPAAFRMDEHLKRLEGSCKLLGMELAYSLDEITAAVAQTVEANDMGRGLIKILAYWGQEAVIQLVLATKLDLAIFAVPASDELGLDQAQPVSACLSKWQKPHPETMPAAAKACANYLNSYLARRDANARGFDLGIMLDTDGFLAEGSIESVFLVKDGIIKTPPLGRILSSITRKSILQAVRAIDLQALEETLGPEDLNEADEIFTCHTGIKALPVARYEDHRLSAPGPVTAKIIELMANILGFKDPRFADWFQILG